MGVWRETLLGAMGIPPAQVHALDHALPLEAAAQAYEAALRAAVRGGAAAAGGEPPRLDALLLGMGPDGHTASLFAGHPLLGEASRWVATISDSPKPPPQRITLTLPVLNAARLALFVCTGASKAEPVVRAFSPEPDVPAGLVLATQRTHWLLDAPAAAGLVEQQAKQAHMYS
jgi:6-phosphogluconolactonase